MTNRSIDVSTFAPEAEFGGRLHLVVKSQDQIERRARMIASLKPGQRLGRMEHRDIATGLWVQCDLREGKIVCRENSKVFEFREPRGLAALGDGRFLLSDVDSVLLVDADAHVLKTYSHPFFAFLHSVSFDSDSQRFLVVSSGYDCLVEMDLEGNVCWEWFAWEHGFNPTLEGVYMFRSQEQANRMRAMGNQVLYVDPNKYKSYGLLTSQRSNHPNSGCYHQQKKDVVLVTLGHSGNVIEISKVTGVWEKVVSGLQMMPHGIQRHENGWMVTNTLLGEFWLLDQDYNLVSKVATRNLPGKPEELGENEWLQAVYPVGCGQFVGLDANRGLIYINLLTKQYRIYAVNETWCVHHMVMSR